MRWPLIPGYSLDLRVPKRQLSSHPGGQAGAQVQILLSTSQKLRGPLDRGDLRSPGSFITKLSYSLAPLFPSACSRCCTAAGRQATASRGETAFLRLGIQPLSFGSKKRAARAFCHCAHCNGRNKLQRLWRAPARERSYTRPLSPSRLLWSDELSRSTKLEATLRRHRDQPNPCSGAEENRRQTKCHGRAENFSFLGNPLYF